MPNHHIARSFDIGRHKGQPAALICDHTGTWHAYPLTPSEAAATAQHLLGQIKMLLIDRNKDRTADTHQAVEGTPLHRQDIA